MATNRWLAVTIKQINKWEKMILTVKEFESLLQDYNRVLGDMVASVTREYKKSVGKCEHCSIEGVTFDFAHRHGFDRPILIKNIFNKYSVKIDDDKIDLNLEKAKNEFKYEHKFNPSVLGLVLCKKCHNKYDGRGKNNGWTN